VSEWSRYFTRVAQGPATSNRDVKLVNNIFGPWLGINEFDRGRFNLSYRRKGAHLIKVSLTWCLVDMPFMHALPVIILTGSPGAIRQYISIGLTVLFCRSECPLPWRASFHQIGAGQLVRYHSGGLLACVCVCCWANAKDPFTRLTNTQSKPPYKRSWPPSGASCRPATTPCPLCKPLMLR
jgi:hypothetical protein